MIIDNTFGELIDVHKLPETQAAREETIYYLRLTKRI
jgi:hypothetical protein